MKIKNLEQLEYLLNCASNSDPTEKIDIKLHYADLDSNKKTGCDFVFQSEENGEFIRQADRQKLKVLEKELSEKNYWIQSIGKHQGVFYIELFEKLIENKKVLLEWLEEEANTSGGEAMNHLTELYNLQRVVIVNAPKIANSNEVGFQQFSLNKQDEQEQSVLKEQLEKWNNANHKEYSITTSGETTLLLVIVME